MIVLDKWESQFVWYSKSWLDSYFVDNELEYLELEIALKNLWGVRCGILPKYIDMVFIAESLYMTVVKCDCFNNNKSAFTFIQDMAIQDHYSHTVQYSNNREYLKRVCWVALYQYLSVLKIFDSNPDRTLIHLEPFEPELFLTKEED
jgi:hypothetical protein